MRVYHLIKGLGRGGAEMLLPEVIRASPIDDATYRVGYFLPWKDHLVPTLEGLGVPVVCFGGTNNARILSQVGRVVADARRWEADVLHCHLPITGAVGRLAGKALGIPVVYTEHNLQERYHRLTAVLNKGTWGLQARAIACSEQVRTSIHGAIGDRVPVTTVENGVSTERFQPRPEQRATQRAALGFDEHTPVMGNVAVFGAPKRLEAWLELAAMVRSRLPSARFVLVGEGPMRPQVERAIQVHGLQDAVVLPGLQEDVRPWLAAMDVYVMSSQFEGLPIALLEAMASGLPPVCTGVGGIPQVIEHGTSGFVVDPMDWTQLKEPVVQLLEDAQARARMGAAARERVQERFSVDVMAQRLLAIYDEVIHA